MDWIYEPKHGRAKISDETIDELMTYTADVTHISSDVDMFKKEFVLGRQATIRKI